MSTKKKSNELPAQPQSDEPTIYQIATLAAGFIRPQDEPAEPSTMRRAASLAFSLWNASAEAMLQWKESKGRQSQIRAYEARVPSVPEWQGKAKKDRMPLSYQRGLEILFQHHRKQHRDSMMLDFLKHIARSAPNGESTGRDNWRRLKKDGFQPGEFSRIATLLPHWFDVRRSLANSDNAKQRTKRIKKPLEGE